MDSGEPHVVYHNDVRCSGTGKNLALKIVNYDF